MLDKTNQSTGYCPDPDCWTAVGEALDGLGLNPGDFSVKIVFRRCLSCGERNIVRDGDFTCALCDSALPTLWNFAPARSAFQPTSASAADRASRWVSGHSVEAVRSCR
ncbi:hypothetical protein [Micromonospora inositola]|uniref:hypothetical protein n=1 Tax=Micromonospora inositola TaxID=47865 RepID=UPI0018D528D6|nr:hypothetical protein [Micromonospora inositola]